MRAARVRPRTSCRAKHLQSRNIRTKGGKCIEAHPDEEGVGRRGTVVTAAAPPPGLAVVAIVQRVVVAVEAGGDAGFVRAAGAGATIAPPTVRIRSCRAATASHG